MAAHLLGINTEDVPAQFEGAVAGRTLIMDGDGPAYRAAATTKRLDAAIRKYHTDMLTQMFMTNSQFLTVHLTSSKSLKNNRDLAMKDSSPAPEVHNDDVRGPLAFVKVNDGKEVQP